MAGLAMHVVRRHLQLKPLRADFQQERRTARRHEAERHIGSKQKHGQGQTGCYVSPPMMNERAHGSCAPCQSARLHATAMPSGTGGPLADLTLPTPLG